MVILHQYFAFYYTLLKKIHIFAEQKDFVILLLYLEANLLNLIL